MPLASPIVYPLINGKRQDGNSIKAKLFGQEYLGFEMIDYDQKKTRTQIEGAHPDPLAKTEGTNKYTGSVNLLLAEWNHWLNNVVVPAAQQQGIAVTGSGFGQVPFLVVVHYKSAGMDWITDTLIGCTIDSITAANKVGNAAIYRKIDLNPLKIYWSGYDSEGNSLVPPAGGL